MAFSVATWALYTTTGTTKKFKTASSSGVAADASLSTGLNIVYSSAFANNLTIGFDDDILESDDDHIGTSKHPCIVTIGTLSGGTTTTSSVKLKVYLGQNTNADQNVSYDINYTSVTLADNPMLCVIKNGRKALITIVSQTNTTNRIMGVFMDSALKQMVVLKDDGVTIGDFQQGGSFDVRSEIFAIPYSYGTTTPPGLTNDERVVSMAPLAVPELLDVFADVFSPIYMRASQSFQQFDIGTDTFVTSGNPTSATGAQFVVRLSPSQNQS